MKTLHLVFFGSLPGLNDIVDANRSGWAVGARQKKSVQKILRMSWIGKEKTCFSGSVKIIVRFYEKNLRRDDDNVFGGLKFILDTLQEMGIIKNDSPKYAHVLPERFLDRNHPRIEIDIFEMEKENEKS